MSQRTNQVSELISHRISMIIQRDIELPSGTLLTVTRVNVSSSFQHADVWISIMPKESVALGMKELLKHKKKIQLTLNDELSMKFIPKIHFKIDKKMQEGFELEDLLDQVKNDDASNVSHEEKPTAEAND